MEKQLNLGIVLNLLTSYNFSPYVSVQFQKTLTLGLFLFSGFAVLVISNLGEARRCQLYANSFLALKYWHSVVTGTAGWTSWFRLTFKYRETWNSNQMVFFHPAYILVFSELKRCLKWATLIEFTSKTFLTLLLPAFRKIQFTTDSRQCLWPFSHDSSLISISRL